MAGVQILATTAARCSHTWIPSLQQGYVGFSSWKRPMQPRGKQAISYYVYLHAKFLQSCPTLCDTHTLHPPHPTPPHPHYHGLQSAGSSVHGILQARILKWLSFPSPEDLLDPGVKTVSLMFPALAVKFFTTGTIWETYQ